MVVQRIVLHIDPKKVVSQSLASGSCVAIDHIKGEAHSMALGTFFNDSREQSAIKSAIVAKYFWAWAKVIIPTMKMRGGKIAYVDLFAGPGRYKDGTKSTPLLILESALADSDMPSMLMAVFNDKDPENASSLEKEIERLPGIDHLRHKPRIFCEEIGLQLPALLRELSDVPTLLFLDPWGYKGLSQRLVNSVLRNWGCDCIIFFNYNRISMGVTNESVHHHLEALLGAERLHRLQNSTAWLAPHDRELLIVEEMSQALKEMGGKFVLPFRFRNDVGNRTSHHLFFVSKHFRGYEIMKGIMAKESSTAEQGVASFEYNPADVRCPLLFELGRPLDDLEGLLRQRYAGVRIGVQMLYEEHSVGKPYTKSNYKHVLSGMLDRGLVTVERPEGKKIRKNTFPDDVLISFPDMAGS